MEVRELGGLLLFPDASLSKWEDFPHHPLLNRGLRPAPPAPPRVFTTPTRGSECWSLISLNARTHARTHTHTRPYALGKLNSFLHSFPVMVTSVRLSRGETAARTCFRGKGDHRGPRGGGGGGGQTEAPPPPLFRFDETTRKLLR